MIFLTQFFKFLFFVFHSDAGLNKEFREKKLIVSLTTIGFRIRKVHKVIFIILKQSMKADKIILYLDALKFSESNLPKILKVYRQIFGIEIRFVEDIGPHTKYFWAMKEFPDDIIITVDDDVRYPKDLISELFSSYQRFPQAISARRGHFITFDENQFIKKYVDWEHKSNRLIDTPSLRLFATGIGGVLYPPHLMHTELYNLNKLKDLSLKNDDIWLKFMQVMNLTPVVLTTPYRTKHIKGSQKIALNQENVRGGGNDLIVKNLINEYNLFFGEHDSLTKRMIGEKN